MCSFVSSVSLCPIHSSHCFLSLFRSFNSCALSAFGAVLSYTILRQSFTAPFSSLLLLLPSFPLGPGSHSVHLLLIYLRARSKSLSLLKTLRFSVLDGPDKRHTWPPRIISCSIYQYQAPCIVLPVACSHSVLVCKESLSFSQINT